MLEALESLKVPPVIDRRFAPLVGALIAMMRETSRIALVLEPLVTVIGPKLQVGPLPETVPFELPKKFVVTVAVVFKSRVPSTVKLPDAIELNAPPIFRM